MLFSFFPGQSLAPQYCSISSMIGAKLPFPAGLGSMMVADMMEPVMAAEIHNGSSYDGTSDGS